jgi:riboflavin synthase
MFTGLIEATGTVVTLDASRITLAAPALNGRWRTGDSIAVNGVCLTALDTGEPSHFAADLAAETLARTTLGSLATGAIVNLELPTPAGSPLGGHVVQGHVDATGWIEGIFPLHADLSTTDWRLTIEAPAELGPYIIPQGSVTIDGISLTVAKVYGSHPDGSIRFDIAIIPHTYRMTNLHSLEAHSKVNIETDVLARYAANRMTHQQDWLTADYLLARGY